MGILKTLTDEYFDKVIRGENRIEFNTKDLKPVDMGGTVFWADRNLMSKGGNTPFEEHFSFKELYEYKFKFGEGWRLPTWKECRELFKKVLLVKSQATGEPNYQVLLNLNVRPPMKN